MNLFNINQSSPQQRQSQNDHASFQADLKAMHALQLLQQQQQLQHQLSIAQQQQQHQHQQSQFLNRFGNNNANNGTSWRQNSNQNQHPSNALDHAAKYHRSSAAFYDPSCTWSGVLPPRNHRFITYSPKVFLGGIPWDVSEQSLIQIFKPFGQIKIEWPGKEQNAAQPKGYVYVIFESEKQVKALLQVSS